MIDHCLYTVSKFGGSEAPEPDASDYHACPETMRQKKSAMFVRLAYA
jgi:hypothetical protein